MIATNSVASGETNMSWCASHAGRDEHRSRSIDAGSESMAFVMVAELREDCERDARAGGQQVSMGSAAGRAFGDTTPRCVGGAEGCSV